MQALPAHHTAVAGIVGAIPAQSCHAFAKGQKNFEKQLAKRAWLAILGPMKATFTLKNSIHGITETFIVLENSVIIECSVNFGGTIQQAVEVTLEEARMHWKEYTANGWVRI